TLHRLGVEVLFHRSREGRLYGLTYIDEAHQVAFNGSELGREYSAAAIERYLHTIDPATVKIADRKVIGKNAPHIHPATDSIVLENAKTQSLITTLLTADKDNEVPAPGLLSKNRRRKKRKPRPNP